MDEARLFQDRLLATKLFVPRPSHPLIQRPRLTTLLTQGLQRKLTLISAPAGFGKTTLLSSWVQSLPQDTPETPYVAWVSLDADDNEPVLFWSYVLTALDKLQSGLFAPLLTYLQTPQAPSVPIRSVLQTLINTLVGRNERFLLIFDDYHVISEAKVHQSLIYFWEHLPPQVQIMIATRADPPLLLSLLRARGEVLEIRTNQLRCTREESTAFLEEVMDIHLPIEISQEVNVRTEGWLVGLQLLGLSLQGHSDPAHLLDEVSGSQRYILDYLIEEILRRQPLLVQTFLLHTCILERLSAPLCDEVLAQTGSQEFEKFLECYNVFVVPLDGQRHWYRYHTLFAEALRSRLEQTEGEAVSALHLSANRGKPVYILVVDDDPFANTLVQFVLTKEGYDVVTTDNPRGALQMIQKREPDLLLLDVTIPYLNGFEIISKLQAEGYDIPVIFMTARDAIEDKLRGFHSGADDYICKPFNHQELVARVHAVLRRIKQNNTTGNSTIRCGIIELFPAELKVVLQGRLSITLTLTEMRVLRMLMSNAGQVVKRDQLLDEIWNEAEGGSNIVDVYIRRLRAKLKENAERPQHILSIRGIGYKFV